MLKQWSRQVSVSVIAIKYEGGVSEDAPLANVKRCRALDERVVRKYGAGADGDTRVAIAKLSTEPTSKFNPRTHNESPAARHVQAEARTQIHRPVKFDPSMRISEFHPPSPEPRHGARPWAGHVHQPNTPAFDP